MISVQHLKQDKIWKKIIWETRISQHKHYNKMQRTVREELVCTPCQQGASEVPVRMSRRKLKLWSGAYALPLIVLVRDLFCENQPIKDQTVNLQHKHYFRFSTQVIKLKIDWKMICMLPQVNPCENMRIKRNSFRKNMCNDAGTCYGRCTVGY